MLLTPIAQARQGDGAALAGDEEEAGAPDCSNGAGEGDGAGQHADMEEREDAAVAGGRTGEGELSRWRRGGDRAQGARLRGSDVWRRHGSEGERWGLGESVVRG